MSSESVGLPNAPEVNGVDLPTGPPIDKLPKEILWLLDAPLFIDEVQVNALYDAILRPDYEGATATLSRSITGQTTIGAEATVGANLPWFGKAEVTGSGQYARTNERGGDFTYATVSNAYRHLLALALHYAADPLNQKRLVIASADLGSLSTLDGAGNDIDENWLTDGYIQEVPRGLVFLDLPKRAKLIPAAIELTTGNVNVVADELAKRLSEAKREDFPEKYPGSDATDDEKDKYFAFFEENWDDRLAMTIVEEAVEAQRSAWVAYNVPIRPGGRPSRFLHLNVAGRGKYETGVFAYNFITRGYNYGLRIVGTLKSGPDLNVLAIFEH